MSVRHHHALVPYLWAGLASQTIAAIHGPSNSTALGPVLVTLPVGMCQFACASASASAFDFASAWLTGLQA